MRSAIHSFQAYVDGKQLIGKLMQKDDAKATYDGTHLLSFLLYAYLLHRGH